MKYLGISFGLGIIWNNYWDYKDAETKKVEKLWAKTEWHGFKDTVSDRRSAHTQNKIEFKM